MINHAQTVMKGSQHFRVVYYLLYLRNVGHMTEAFAWGEKPG